MPPKRSTASKKAQSAVVITTKKRALSPEKFSSGDISSSAPVSHPAAESPTKREKTSNNDNVTQDIGVEEDSRPGDKNDKAHLDSKSNVPDFTGVFDLYSMELDFLYKVYSPAGHGAVYPEELYKTILKYQAIDDKTPKSLFLSITRVAMMENSRQPYSTILVMDVDITGFKSIYKAPVDLWHGPGIKARMEVDGGGCGILESSGKISMQPLWKSVDADGKTLELFEGIFILHVVYSSLYSRKGHGRGQKLTISFWAIRGLGSVGTKI